MRLAWRPKHDLPGASRDVGSAPVLDGGHLTRSPTDGGQPPPPPSDATLTIADQAAWIARIVLIVKDGPIAVKDRVVMLDKSAPEGANQVGR